MKVNVTIELEVAPGNEAGLKDFLGSLVKLQGPECNTVTPDPVPATPIDPLPEEPAAPKRTRSRSKKEEPAAPATDPAPEPTPEPAPVAKHPESRQGQPALPTYDKLPEATVNPKPRYTIEWVRNLLAEKVGKYRAECKQKLSDLGAANVSSLDPEKYSDFVDFLNTLSV